jgi:uncharacterized protein (TIGR03437 family)
LPDGHGNLHAVGSFAGFSGTSISVTSLDASNHVAGSFTFGGGGTDLARANAGTPVESSAQAAVTPEVSWPSLVPAQGCLSSDCFSGGAIHQDWSSYVTPDRPASPGEVLHLYGTGFSPVQPAVATGMPASASPLAVVPATPMCTSDPGGPTTVVYLGLAPGLVGYYQMDGQLPAPFPSGHPTENRTYDQFYITCGPSVTPCLR